MTDAVRMTNQERSLELLREMVEFSVQRYEFPEESVVRVRVHDEPWVVDDLIRAEYMSSVHPRLVPTIAGLRVIKSEGAANTLNELKRLFQVLKEIYQEQPERTSTTAEIAQRFGASVQTTGWLLMLLSRQALLFTRCSYDMSAMIVDVTIGSAILQANPFDPDASDSESEHADGPVKITAHDFMGLEHVEFSSEGVCLLVGPNGSGKSSVLQALAFLRDTFQRGISNAIKFQRGLSGFKRVGAGRNADVVLGFGVGDVSWEIRLPIQDRSISPFPGEIVKTGASVLLRRGSHQEDWYLGSKRRGSPNSEGRTCLREVWETQSPRVLEPLVRALRSYRMYSSYALDSIRNGGTGGDTDRVLEPNGENLFVVLRNWKVAPREFRHRFEWVIKHLRRAFKGIIEDIEFAPPVGQVVPATFFPVGSSSGLPMSRAAEGLLVGLLHLTAVAGAREGAILAIEEMENFLHPHAIRSIVASMREIAEKQRLTILLTTHSPLLMNVFRDRPDQVFVMEPGRKPLPVPLTELHDPDWIAHFQIGDLYDRMEFGAPVRSEGS